MIVPDAKIPAVRSVINTLYSRTFTEETVQEVASSVAEAVDGHYFAVLFFPNKFVSKHFFLSNNPPEFMPVYEPLIPKDFLIKNLVETFNVTLLHELADWGFQQRDEFCTEVQRIRPISDVVYVPLRIGGSLAGYWALGRAGLDSPFYSKNDVDIFKFLSGFLTEAFRRSLYPHPLPEDTALLDAEGRVLQAGGRLQTVFEEIFGQRFSENPGAGPKQENRIFKSRYRAFLMGRNTPGRGELTFAAGMRTHTLCFSYLNIRRLRIFLPKEPQVMVTLRSGRRCSEEADLLDLPLLSSRYGFTPREGDIIRGIYRGCTNKDIGDSLRIGEATVKRHVYNIFEKTGVNSRARLVLKMGIS